MSHPIWAFPGFLGLKSDWDIFKFQNLQPFDPCEFQWSNLPDWGKKFNQLHTCHSAAKPLLMGYSFGGRLALHALIDDPSLWQAAIIISAHPGLENNEERLIRLQIDEQWGRRFEQDNWESVWNDWNKQPLFKQDAFRFKRNENDYDRSHLFHLLQAGSLGLQANLRDEIFRLNLPILWINGAKDVKFCKLAQSIQLSHPLSRKVIIPQAGHRAPWDQPKTFQDKIKDFILK